MGGLTGAAFLADAKKRLAEQKAAQTSIAAQFVRTVAAVPAKITGPLFPVLGGSPHVTQTPGAGHMGLDIGATPGSRVVAPVAGVVSRVQQSSSGYGTAVWMIDPKTGKELTFGHLLRKFVEVGQKLVAGQVLGEVGSSGASSGPHLHFEVGAPGAQAFNGNRTEAGAIDPLAWLQGAKPASASGLTWPVSPTVTPPGKAGSMSPGQTTALSASSSVTAGLKPAAAIEVPVSSGLGVVGVPGGIKPSTLAPVVQAASAKAAAAGGPFGWVQDALNPDIKDSAASKLKGYLARSAFVTAGMLCVVLGLAIYAYTFREQIGNAAAKVGGAALGTAAGNPAAATGLMTAAVVAPP